MTKEEFIINLDALTFTKSLKNESVNLLLTDPPFGTGKTQSLKSTGKAYADLDVDALADLMEEVAATCVDKLAPDGVMAVLLDYRGVHAVHQAISRHLYPRGELIWHFETGGLAKRWWSNKHNTVLLFTKGPKVGKFCFDRVPTVERKAPVRSYVDPKKVNSVWNINMSTSDPQRVGYPTQKPEELFARIVDVHTDPGDLVVDPFCGSGTTGVVAKRLGRRWAMCDISVEAVAISRSRLDEVTQPS